MEKHIVAIVTYNRLALLRECLEAVMAQTKMFDGLVVVDNASLDGTGTYLKEFRQLYRERFPGMKIRIILEHENRGGAGGFSRAVFASMEMNADWITLIDDDAILEPDYLHEIVKGMDSTDRKYAAYAGIPLTDGIRIGHRRRVKGLLIKREIPVPLWEYEKESFACDIASFCGLTVSAETVKKIGLPDRHFFIWYDDTEYCLRISSHGPILNWNAARILHKASVGSKGATVSWKDYYGIRNRLYMARKHYNDLTAVVIVLKKMTDCARKCCLLLKSGKQENARYTAQLYWSAVSDGLYGRMGENLQYLP